MTMGVGDLFLGAASWVDDIPQDMKTADYIANESRTILAKTNKLNARLSDAKIAEMTNDYKSLKMFGKIGRFGGGILSAFGSGVNIYQFARDPSVGRGIRAGLSIAATCIGLYCSGPIAAVGLIAWGLFDCIYGDNVFN